MLQLLNLVRSLTARRLSMLREMSSKVEQLLQQQISLSISSEVLRRRKHMMHASGSEDMIPVDTVSQQVSNALNEVPGVPHDQQSCSPVSSQQSKNQYDESLSAQFVRSPNNVTWMKRNRSSAKHAALLACECLHSGILSSTSLHQLVRSMVQHRLDGCIGWGLINRCLRLANKRGLGGPKGFKSLREYRGCLELLVNVHACEVRFRFPLSVKSFHSISSFHACGSVQKTAATCYYPVLLCRVVHCTQTWKNSFLHSTRCSWRELFRYL